MHLFYTRLIVQPYDVPSYAYWSSRNWDKRFLNPKPPKLSNGDFFILIHHSGIKSFNNSRQSPWLSRMQMQSVKTRIKTSKTSNLLILALKWWPTDSHQTHVSARVNPKTDDVMVIKLYDVMVIQLHEVKVPI